MKPSVWLGESVRWYLKHARHPFKNYIVGHYWGWFSRPRLWIRYDAGTIIGVQIGDYLQQRIFFDGHYEATLIEWLKRTLQPTDVFWDVGANIGAVTIVAARLCQRVVAFEPNPPLVERLRENLRANGLTNVEIIPSALGAQPGRAPLFQPERLNTGMSTLLPGRGSEAGATDVSVIRADDLVATRPELAPTIMKIDVEGAEHLVLGGAMRMLQTGRVRAIVFEDRCDANAQPTNAEALARLSETHYLVEPFGASDAHTNDGMRNFLATLSAAA